MPVWVFLPSRLRASSAPMNLRCFSVLAGMGRLLSGEPGITLAGESSRFRKRDPYSCNGRVSDGYAVDTGTASSTT
jgi:hypothetical protein